MKKPVKFRVMADEGPLYKAKFPADVHGLFCKKCQDMYRKNDLLENHVILHIHPDSQGDEMKGMMPLLRAWAAFIDHFTGVKTTFTMSTFDSVNNPAPVVQAKFGKGTVLENAFNTISLVLQDERYDGSIPGYAYAQGSNIIKFKTGVLVGLDRGGPLVKTPGEALMYMVHEATAHRFFLNYKHLGGAKKDLRENATHYGGRDSHCESSKRGQNKCLNGFIVPAYPNAKNALPFFEKWYNDHKDDKLTMFTAPQLPPVAPPAPQLPPVAPAEEEEDDEVEAALAEFIDGEAPPVDPPRRRGAPGPEPRRRAPQPAFPEMGIEVPDLDADQVFALLEAAGAVPAPAGRIDRVEEP